ncbi:hypothetical protein EV1_017876 [Malus domestica]
MEHAQFVTQMGRKPSQSLASFKLKMEILTSRHAHVLCATTFEIPLRNAVVRSAYLASKRRCPVGRPQRANNNARTKHTSEENELEVVASLKVAAKVRKVLRKA